MSHCVTGQESLEMDAASCGGATFERLSSLIDWPPIRGAERPRSKSPAKARRAITLHLTLSDRVALGHGKADLLTLIHDTSSIAATGRSMGMPYQRAHDLVSALTADFRTPLVETMAGGPRGGGAKLTVLGEQVLAAYREVERQAEPTTAERLGWLRAMLRG